MNPLELKNSDVKCIYSRQNIIGSVLQLSLYRKEWKPDLA